MLISLVGVWLKQCCSSMWRSDYVWVKTERVSVTLSDKSTVPDVTSLTIQAGVTTLSQSLTLISDRITLSLPGRQQRELTSHSWSQKEEGKDRTQPGAHRCWGSVSLWSQTHPAAISGCGTGSAPWASATTLSAPEQKRITAAKSHSVILIPISLKVTFIKLLSLESKHCLWIKLSFGRGGFNALMDVRSLKMLKIAQAEKFGE